MRFAIVIASLLGLAAATGCAGQSGRIAAPDSTDPSFTPPGEMMVTMHSSSTANTNNANNAAVACPQPNKTAIKGKQIRAASDVTARSLTMR